MPLRAHRILIPLAALCAVLPILIKGPSCGHDFDFHLLSWLEAATQFAHLHYPQWAYTPAWNAGEPRFLFYPPLSWSLGALLGLVLPWKLVPAAFTFIALTLCGFAAHRLAALYASANAATLAAVLYLTNPYMLFTAYERTAYGELLAAAWIPLLLYAALAPRVRIVALAIPVALLWLTNAPAAVMSSYALAVVILVRLILNGVPHDRDGAAGAIVGSVASIRPLKSPRIHFAASAIAATILGLALSAFYLIPAAYERRYIQSEMALVEGMRIADNTLFHHMPPVSDDNIAHDAVLHTASLIAITLLIAIVAALLLSLKNVRVPHLEQSYRSRWGAISSTPKFPLLLLTLLIAFLLTRASLPIWARTPELRFLQFPWRLTAILGSILAVFAALAFDRLRLTTIRTCIGSAAIAAALILPAWHFFRQPCDDEDTVEARVALYRSNRGTEPTDEYTPTTADNDSLKPGDPPYWLFAEFPPFTPPKNMLYESLVPPVSVNAPAPPGLTPGQAPSHLAFDLPKPEYLVLNRREFPLWQVLLNGNAVSTTSTERDDGLIAIALPVGHSTIDLCVHRTIDQIVGLIFSILALLILTGLTARHRLLQKRTSTSSARIPSDI